MKKMYPLLLVVVLVFGCNDKPDINPNASQLLVAYPNPTLDQIAIGVQNPNQQSLTLFVFDTRGDKILEESITPAQPQRTFMLSLAARPKGNYLATLRTPSATIHQKFIKL